MLQIWPHYDCKCGITMITNMALKWLQMLLGSHPRIFGKLGIFAFPEKAQNSRFLGNSKFSDNPGFSEFSTSAKISIFSELWKKVNFRIFRDFGKKQHILWYWAWTCTCSKIQIMGLGLGLGPHGPSLGITRSFPRDHKVYAPRPLNCTDRWPICAIWGWGG